MKDQILQIAIVLIMTYLLFRIRHFILTVWKHEKKYSRLYVWRSDEDAETAVGQSEGETPTPLRDSVLMNPAQAQPVELEAGVVDRSDRVENDLRQRHSKRGFAS